VSVCVRTGEVVEILDGRIVGGRVCTALGPSDGSGEDTMLVDQSVCELATTWAD